jgi:hypothetical protein
LRQGRNLSRTFEVFAENVGSVKSSHASANVEPNVIRVPRQPA